MEIPNCLIDEVSDLIALEKSRAEREGFWSTIYGLVPVKDGDRWLVLFGENAQAGVCGFGKSPEKAIYAFEVAMREEIT